jgi:hypothetical protein
MSDTRPYPNLLPSGTPDRLGRVQRQIRRAFIAAKGGSQDSRSIAPMLSKGNAVQAVAPDQCAQSRAEGGRSIGEAGQGSSMDGIVETERPPRGDPSSSNCDCRLRRELVLLPPPPRQQRTRRHDQTRQSCADDGAGNGGGNRAILGTSGRRASLTTDFCCQEDACAGYPPRCRQQTKPRAIKNKEREATNSTARPGSHAGAIERIVEWAVKRRVGEGGRPPGNLKKKAMSEAPVPPKSH